METNLGPHANELAMLPNVVISIPIPFLHACISPAMTGLTSTRCCFAFLLAQVRVYVCVYVCVLCGYSSIPHPSLVSPGV